nr:MAG TPA: hypothetical protein [Caudoviricetes sp.]
MQIYLLTNIRHLNCLTTAVVGAVRWSRRKTSPDKQARFTWDDVFNYFVLGFQKQSDSSVA